MQSPNEEKVDPYKYQFFKKKWPINISICPIFGQILSKITRFFPKFPYIWARFGSNLWKFWKINPFIYQILHFIRGHSDTKRLILLPMLVACPCLHRVFCTEYPPMHPGILHGSLRCLVSTILVANKAMPWSISNPHRICRDMLYICCIFRYSFILIKGSYLLLGNR